MIKYLKGDVLITIEVIIEIVNVMITEETSPSLFGSRSRHACWPACLMILLNKSECRPHASRLPAINVGLPRTATLWLAHLFAQLGLRSLHCNSGPSPRNVYNCVMPRGTSWEVAQHYRRAVQKRNTSLLPSWVRSYAALGDVPWYFAPASFLRAMSPNASFFISTRKESSWRKSITLTIARPLVAAIKRTNWSCNASAVYGAEAHTKRSRGPPLGAYLSLLEYSQELFVRYGSLDALQNLCEVSSPVLSSHSLGNVFQEMFEKHQLRVQSDFDNVTVVDPGNKGWLSSVLGVVTALGIPIHCVNITLATKFVSQPMRHGKIATFDASASTLTPSTAPHSSFFH